MLATIMEIIRDLLIFVAVMFALCIVLIVVISKMPDDNPLKRILTALARRHCHAPNILAAKTSALDRLVFSAMSYG
jgi:hypothetical protein